jgi:hypothetical protein
MEVAALGLGILQHASAKLLIQEIRPQTPMLEVAQALLGDGGRLRGHHFASEQSNQELQLAAVQAVIRSKGRHGLELALGYKQATHWWEEEFVARELSRMLQTEDAPGKQKLADCKDLVTLQKWFASHGVEYLRRLEAKP